MDPCTERMRQGPFMVRICKFVSLDLEKTDKLELKAWFEVKPTFGPPPPPPT